MKTRLISFLFLAALAVGLLFAFSESASAQQPPLAPTQASNGAGLSDNLSALTQRAAQLIPYFTRNVESPLLNWFETLALWLGAVVMCLSFLRLLRENGGATEDLAWWIARLAVCLALFGTGPSIINYAHNIGQQIAIGSDSGDAWLNRVLRNQQDSFNQSYQKFSMNVFTVQTNGQEQLVQPGDNSTGGVLGALYDRESTPQDIDHKLDISSWELPKLFLGLNLARGILEFGDFFLLILGGFLSIALRLAAPFMLAVAIDRQLAQRITYPFAWSVAVFTLVTPVVSQLIRIIAYSAGNIAMALGDGGPIHHWDSATMSVITDPSAQPVYTVVIAALIMGIAGLTMFASPYISYRLAVGQVFEAVSSIVSGWMGAITSTGVEAYSASASAAISNQARQTEIQGGYQADILRAKGELTAANLNARAGQISSTANAQGGLITALGAIRANQVTQSGLIDANTKFGIAQTQNQGNLSVADLEGRKDQSVQEHQINQQQQGTVIEGQRSAEKTELWGRKADRAGQFVGDIVKGGANRNAGAARQIVGSGIEAVGGAIELRQEYKAIGTRADTQLGALHTATDQKISNDVNTAQRLQTNQKSYVSQQTEAYNTNRVEQRTAVDAGTGIASGSAQRGTSIAVGGINQAYKLNLQGNQSVYDSRIAGAESIRNAASEAAKLNAVAQVVGSLGHNVARRIDETFGQLRY